MAIEDRDTLCKKGAYLIKQLKAKNPQVNSYLDNEEIAEILSRSIHWHQEIKENVKNL